MTTPPEHGPPAPPVRAHRDAVAAARLTPDTTGPDELEQLYSTPQVAKLFAVTTETVRRWIAEGQLQGIQINGQWRVPRSSLMALTRKRLL